MEDLKTTTPGSANAGNPDELIAAGSSANSIGGGKPTVDEKIDLSNYVEKSQYEEAVKKISEQGTELGETRNFFKEIQPLLDKLQEQPTLVEAIMEGKVNSSLAEAVLEGKVTIGDATKVAEAHEQVKVELGQKKYKDATPEEIEARILERLTPVVEEKFKKAAEEMKSSSALERERKDFEEGVAGFVKNTPDFAEYAEGVNKWLDDHPTQYDIEIAYDAVKGKVLATKMKEGFDLEKAEEEKRLAGNAGGGMSQGGKVIRDENIVDQLIASGPNPNVL
ncbi:MAG: hypothetical protein WCW29_04320 [Candidatus Paceibacterota bacterium]|jgi:hypothetical protein